jgi:hypothetical protein
MVWSCPLTLSQMPPPTSIEVTYGGEFGAKEQHTLKRNMDVFIDHVGIAKVQDIQVSNDQLLVRLEDGTPPVMMDTKKIRPLSTIQEYELLRLLNLIGNKRKMVAIGLESPPPKVDSKKRAKRVVPASIPATDRVLRRRPTIAHGEESTPECHLSLTDGL